MSGSKRAKIQQAVRELGKADKFEIYTGTVSAASESEQTINVDLDSNVTLFKVRLKAITNNTFGFWLLPKMGSEVVIAELDGTNDYVLISASEIDKLFVKIGDTTLVLNSTGIVANNGTFNGVPKVTPLTQSINNIENKLNQLIGLLNSWVPIPNDGGASLKALLTTWIASVLVVTTQASIENPKLKH